MSRKLCLLVDSLLVAVACSAQGSKGSAAKPPLDRSSTSLASLLPAGSPLLNQNLTFDSSFAKLAVEYEAKPDPALAKQIAASPAVAHILRHATNFDYDVPKDSPQDLVTYLLKPTSKQSERISTCKQSLAYFTGPMLADPGWIGDALRYLPAGFRFHGTLFLTFGYDIGGGYRAYGFAQLHSPPLSEPPSRTPVLRYSRAAPHRFYAIPAATSFV